MAAEIREIPIFPLDIFLLPGENMQLFIFEERYKQLVRDCLEAGCSFGIAFSHNSNTRNYGSMVEIIDVLEEYPGGEMDISIRAVSVFMLKEFFHTKQGKLYPGGIIHGFSFSEDVPARDDLIASFRNYSIHSGYDTRKSLQDNKTYVFNIAGALCLDEVSKLELVGLDTYDEINNFLINYIRFLELIRKQEKSAVFNNIYLN